MNRNKFFKRSVNSKKYSAFFLLVLVLLMLYGCSVKWPEAMQRGKIAKTAFRQSIAFEEKMGLIIVSVQINGIAYRFLFDTGAPLSISDKVWQVFDFKVISNGHIVDSDNNRTKVNYVQIDTLLLGDIPFVNQTAFVAGFESNPKIKCLEIDGIIGSNLIRHCNWEIDFMNSEIVFYSTANDDTQNTDGAVAVPFYTDNQYNILVDLKIGDAVIRNLTIDYGSNGSLSLPKNVFQALKEKGIIDTTFSISGIAQSGLLGKEIMINREITYVDTIIMGDLLIDNVEINSGKAGLIGSKILSDFFVTIDWGRSQLLLNEVELADKRLESYGFTLGYSEKKNIYVQSVIEGSPAFRAGVEPDMGILKMGSLNFANGNTFCDCMNYFAGDSDTISLMLKLPDNSMRRFFLEKGILQN